MTNKMNLQEVYLFPVWIQWEPSLAESAESFYLSPALPFSDLCSSCSKTFSMFLNYTH